ncbi:EAL domain-containing protein (putative c-di-GMP-specific phosphodiesterase class I) [Litoreibacter ponti]|uniref:EAL domain-containing protein (Putative c-di-GMP-specific phosphodiesterase class I) n=1 Tax=Litoreibacter ponti TaxID=1510457 RepID=A0A2T6BMP2_9RHOB|nr:EAL domain-containing protein [Litoreibacter ponti]PTX57358.1 EAL domain-containing protein (putative c-di-GMP-specific phosphodiesterase class I) [Litoreibacter ponti]
MSFSSNYQDSPLSAAVAERDANILTMVRSALRRRDVMLAYQPVVQGRDPSRVAFFEGLIRVLDETGRIIPAKDFIETIEAREEGRMIDCLAIELGLMSLTEDSTLRLSINMSARSIGNPDWETAFERGILRDPTVADRLIIEITESSAMLVPDQVIEFMTRMQRRGISFALDDFGAGYTAFRHFKEFCFDMVKIDQTFTHNVHVDTDNQVLMEALVSIAEQFDMFCVAEGVEKLEEAEYLAQIGLDCLQGYYFGVPSITKPWERRAAQSDLRRSG